MNVAMIEIGGKVRPVKFGFNALIEFSELTGKTIDELNSLSDKNMTMKQLLILCWCGLKAGARREGQEFNASVEDVADWLDENPSLLLDITMEYAKSKEVDPRGVKKNRGVKRSR